MRECGMEARGDGREEPRRIGMCPDLFGAPLERAIISRGGAGPGYEVPLTMGCIGEDRDWFGMICSPNVRQGHSDATARQIASTPDQTKRGEKRSTRKPEPKASSLTRLTNCRKQPLLAWHRFLSRIRRHSLPPNPGVHCANPGTAVLRRSKKIFVPEAFFPGGEMVLSPFRRSVSGTVILTITDSKT